MISRAADILRVLEGDTTGLSLAKIANKVGLPRSTVQRIVNALVVEEFVTVDHSSTGYSIGPGIQALAQNGRRDVSKSLRPVLERLSKETGETVDLGVFQSGQMTFIEQVVGTQRLRAVSAIGESFPMTMTANGKAAMALMETAELTQVFEREIESEAADQRVRFLTKELELVRSNGYALDEDEHTNGISAVGMAFQTDDQIYAISIPAPSHRFATARDLFIQKLLSSRSEIRRAVSGAAHFIPENL